MSSLLQVTYSNLHSTEKCEGQETQNSNLQPSVSESCALLLDSHAQEGKFILLVTHTSRSRMLTVFMLPSDSCRNLDHF